MRADLSPEGERERGGREGGNKPSERGSDVCERVNDNLLEKKDNCALSDGDVHAYTQYVRMDGELNDVCASVFGHVRKGVCVSVFMRDTQTHVRARKTKRGL